MVYRHIPATAYAQVGALGDDVHHAGVMGKLADGFRGAVGTAVIHYHEVEGEVGLLLEHAADGIADGSHTIPDGYDHRGLHGKLALAEVHVVALIAVQIGIERTQMAGACPLHLQLACSVARIDVVKLLLTA